MAADKRIASKMYKGVYSLKQKDGDISYSILYKGSDGKNQREAIGLKSEGITLTFAHNKRAERINSIKHGVDPIAHKKKSSSGFENIWDFYVANKALSDAIRKDYKGRWKKHMSKDFSDSVTMEKLIEFRTRLENLKKPLSARSIDMMIGMIGSAIRYWNSRPVNKVKVHDYVSDLRAYDRDHVTKKDKRTRKVKRDRFLNADEIKELKEYIANLHPEISLFVSIALSTGARLGAIMSIKAKDISDNKIMLIDEKDGNDRYTAYLDKDTLSMLNPILIDLNPNCLLFKLTKGSLQKRLQRILNKLFNEDLETSDRVNRVVVHTLRHTFASHLVMKGTPIVIVQKLLNHSELETTARYAHLAPDAGYDAVMELWS